MHPIIGKPLFVAQVWMVRRPGPTVAWRTRVGDAWYFQIHSAEEDTSLLDGEKYLLGAESRPIRAYCREVSVDDRHGFGDLCIPIYIPRAREHMVTHRRSIY